MQSNRCNCFENVRERTKNIEKMREEERWGREKERENE